VENDAAKSAGHLLPIWRRRARWGVACSGTCDDLEKPRPPVLVKWSERESGFRLELTFSIGVDVPSRLAGMVLASRLAEALGQEILTSPPENPDGATSSPESWVLALPTGELYVVRQINPGSDAVEIDRSPERRKDFVSP
jgi:hypothetical protein